MPGPYLASPLDHDLFGPTARVVLALLLGGLVLLLVVERRHLREWRQRPLLQRWVTWAVIAPTWAVAALSGSAAMAALVLAASLQALREYASLVELPGPYRLVLLSLGVVAAPAALVSPDFFFALPPVLLLLATLQLLAWQGIHSGVRHLAFAALGWAYLAWLLAFIVLTHRYLAGGVGLLLLLALSVALSDIGAFTVGSLLGRHLLAPRLSPGKTWEGLVGNLVGAIMGVALMGYAWPGYLTWPLALGLGALIAVGAAWGDLVESAMKREFEVKDAGAWLPGFGGILDRIDSLVIVAPLAYYSIRAAAQASS